LIPLPRKVKKTEVISKAGLEQDSSNYPDKLSNEINDITVLDDTNIKIIKELLQSPDLKSIDLSTKLKVPLSTIQRRRTRLESSILKKKYDFELAMWKYRTASINVKVERGRAEETGKEILDRFPDIVVRVSTRLNTHSNIAVDIIYKTSQDLHSMLEQIKSMPYVSYVDWSEIVKVIGDNTYKVIDNVLQTKN
jgi:DNA-binding Lrp family transcriptional regulator